uniref:Ig-like domain-containing protein n=1 Tax=Periophthalmus magnuspinnatus TaxID=409849 RepID=A0A3B4BII3_9GOBI
RVMASLLFLLLSSSSVLCPAWSDAVVAREGILATLVCIDENATGAVSVNWMVKSLGTDRWRLVLSANERKEFSGGAAKDHMQLTDHNFQDSGVFSLAFRPEMDDGGLYMCLVKRRQNILMERVVLLMVLEVTVAPPSPVPQLSTLRLLANVQPDIAVRKITWIAPGDIAMKTEKVPKFGIITKLPQVQNSDDGAYVCMVYPKGNSSNAFFAFNVDVAVDADRVASFTNINHGQQISTAVQSQSVLPLSCPQAPGDYVMLYWRPPDAKNENTRLVHQFDRWRGFTLTTELSNRLQLAGPPYDPQEGSFSFLLSPLIRDGGLYMCEVFSNDNAFSLRTLLTVVRVKARTLPTQLELDCRYSELSQVRRAIWTHPNQSVRLQMDGSPGHITTSIDLPVRAESAGNYTCVILLKNKQTVRATYTVSLHPSTTSEGSESVEVTASSLLPSLSALLLIVPLVAAVVGALLWRRRHISDRGVEQSLSVRSGEAENIYENPEDIRQVTQSHTSTLMKSLSLSLSLCIPPPGSPLL